ncbi:hypothetical protein [Serratia quinivorans]|uniref:hypothetical protein n=1 Tax=Serratia quinivorans TaxID=137545 RepID=UPI002178EEE9|nr:hypothetical protein [Serratia quinivorans]CAI2035478.1 Uncharacterised protein [Serratia quinivorans]
MSELLSSTMENIKERAKNQAYGYIVISILLCNWTTIYYLIFSEKKTEEKLLAISLDYSLFLQLLLPAALGLMMCISSPILNYFIKKILSHYYIKEKTIEYDNDKVIENIIAAKELELQAKREEASLIKAQLDKVEKRFFELNNENQKLESKHNETMQLENNLLKINASLQNDNEKLEIEIREKRAQKNNFAELKNMFDERMKKLSQADEKIVFLQTQIDSLVAFIQGQINSGYFQESEEDDIHEYLGTLGYEVITNNPLRTHSRQYKDKKNLAILRQQERMIPNRPE